MNENHTNNFLQKKVIVTLSTIDLSKVLLVDKLPTFYNKDLFGMLCPNLNIVLSYTVYISITTKPIEFSILRKLYIGPDMVFGY